MTTRKHRTAILASTCLCLMATANARTAYQQPDVLLVASTTSVVPVSLSLIRIDSGCLATTDSTLAVAKTAMAPQVPINAAAQKFVQEYIRKNAEVLQKVAQRSDAVFRIMEPILAKYELPVELKYLAVVESDLERTAVSRVGAAGPWQLMPSTARDLGLHVSHKWDERKHYSKSTVAAAKYLRDLYRYYDDWLLVLAAYNAGPVVVDRAIRKAGSRNFWRLQYYLPAETRGHVKRFIGTHYYFEACGSETTLTKAENVAYNKVLAKYAAMQQRETVLKPVVAVAIERDSPAPEVAQAYAKEILPLQTNK